jgi:outer membrane protein OmpA-like peptidoglycan-associated protein
MLWLIFVLLLVLWLLMLVSDQKAGEEVLAFGDTHFNNNNSMLTNKAKKLLEKDVRVLKGNPKMKIRMAGYISVHGMKDRNLIVSKRIANAVRKYLIGKGISPERIKLIGYDRTKPALHEVFRDEINTKEAKAKVRVLFDVVAAK